MQEILQIEYTASVTLLFDGWLLHLRCRNGSLLLPYLFLPLFLLLFPCKHFILKLLQLPLLLSVVILGLFLKLLHMLQQPDW